mgnify:CR=1 FL=1
MMDMIFDDDDDDLVETGDLHEAFIKNKLTQQFVDVFGAKNKENNNNPDTMPSLNIQFGSNVFKKQPGAGTVNWGPPPPLPPV